MFELECRNVWQYQKTNKRVPAQTKKDKQVCEILKEEPKCWNSFESESVEDEDEDDARLNEEDNSGACNNPVHVRHR